MRILVTGGAGFIGSSLIDRLLPLGHEIINVDNFDPFYAKEIKLRNLAEHHNSGSYQFIEGDITQKEIFRQFRAQPEMIIHLAAKAGVRPSTINAPAYFKTNLDGTLNLLEYAKEHGIKKMLFASSSSVYGTNPSVPWKESDHDLQPISPYAASKIAAENIGRVYSHLYDIRFTVLRFFTVFGPRQRPDLAIHKFFKQIMNEEPINIYGDGSTRRDYTYVDDIVSGIMGAMEYEKKKFDIFNLGNSHTIKLIDLIRNIERICDKKAILQYLPEQPGDVAQTNADISKSQQVLNFNPKTDIYKGLEHFHAWFNSLRNN